MPTVNDTVTTTKTSAGPTVLEDHEAGGAIGDYYVGSTQDFQISNLTNLEGSFLVEATASFGSIGYSGGSTTRGNKYKCRMTLEATGNQWFLVGGQSDTSPNADGYAVRVQEDNDQIDLIKNDSIDGDSVLANAAVTLSTSTEYRVELEYGPTGNTDNLTVTIYDASDTQLATASGTDDEWTGGTWGFYSGSAGSGYMDYITEETI